MIGGEAFFRGRDLMTLSKDQIRSVRGREIAMIFQDPMTALTPVYTVGWQIVEQIQAHTRVSDAEARARAIELLAEVGIANADRRVDDYPHQFSGGMRQRVMIAMALSCNPALLIADEPTTALDVTIQAQILDLLKRLRDDHGSAIVLITHDMGVVAERRRASRGHVRGASGGGSAEVESLPESAASLHLGAPRIGAAPRPTAASTTRRDPRCAAFAARAAGGLPFCAALRTPLRPLLDAAGAARACRARPPGRVPPRRRSRAALRQRALDAEAGRESA